MSEVYVSAPEGVHTEIVRAVCQWMLANKLLVKQNQELQDEKEDLIRLVSKLIRINHDLAGELASAEYQLMTVMNGSLYQ